MMSQKLSVSVGRLKLKSFLVIKLVEQGPRAQRIESEPHRSQHSPGEKQLGSLSSLPSLSLPAAAASVAASALTRSHNASVATTAGDGVPVERRSFMAVGCGVATGGFVVDCRM